MSNSRFHTRRAAFGGVIAALCIAIMFLSGIFPFAEYAIPAAAGILLTALVIDFGQGTAWICYGAAALLSLIAVPNKEAALLFAAFFGCYPILKSVFEKLKSRLGEWACKIAFFNVTVVGAYLLLIYVFGMNEVLDDLNGTLKYGAILLLLLGNAAFILYDRALSGLIVIYLQRIRPKLHWGK